MSPGLVSPGCLASSSVLFSCSVLATGTFSVWFAMIWHFHSVWIRNSVQCAEMKGVCELEGRVWSLQHSLLIVMRLTRGGRQRSDGAHCVVNKGWNLASAVTRQSSNTFMQQPSGNTCTWVYNVCQKLSLSGRMLEGQKIFNLSLLIFCLCVLE